MSYETITDEIPLYSCWQPTSDITGCGIVVKIEEVDGNKIYHFLTDFGNVVERTSEHLFNNYSYKMVEQDPIERYERQKELLLEAYSKYF